MIDPPVSGKKIIVYNVLHTQTGWQIQAFLPKRISPDDRVKIIDWMHNYRSEVRRQNPFWITMFHSTEYAYFLDIIHNNDAKELLAHTIDNGNTWQQLSFEYA